MPQLTKLATAALALLACVFVATALGADPAQKEGAQKAVCVLHPTANNKVHGIVVFTQKDGGVEISGQIEGLTPGPHGFHVHEFGDCSAPDAMSAGGHFDPDKTMHHAGPHDMPRHAGDLGNIDADASGKAMLKTTDKLIQLHGPHSILGRSLIVHAKADDLKSQPSGDAGGRVACGVIGVAKP